MRPSSRYAGMATLFGLLALLASSILMVSAAPTAEQCVETATNINIKQVGIKLAHCRKGPNLRCCKVVKRLTGPGTDLEGCLCQPGLLDAALALVTTNDLAKSVGVNEDLVVRVLQGCNIPNVRGTGGAACPADGVTALPKPAVQPPAATAAPVAPAAKPAPTAKPAAPGQVVGVLPQPAAQGKPAAEPKPAAEGKPAAEPKPAAEGKPAAEPKPAAEGKPAAEPKPAAEGKPAAEPKPAAEAKPAPAAPTPKPSPTVQGKPAGAQPEPAEEAKEAEEQAPEAGGAKYPFLDKHPLLKQKLKNKQDRMQQSASP